MPSMASITVKKADEATNIVYDALSASSGQSAAIWRQDTGAVAALPVALRATARVKTIDNGPKTARRTLVNYERPYAFQNTTTGLYSSEDRVVVKVDIIAPSNMPAAEIAEGVRQGLNFASAVLIKQTAETGFAPT